LPLQDLIEKISKLSHIDREIITGKNEILDQKRVLGIKIEDGIKYDIKSVKTMFHIARDSIRLDIRDITGSAPYVVIRYILDKARKHKKEITLMLRFSLEKMIDTKELVDIIRPYERILKHLIIKIPVCFYINHKM
jgi:hypothetical protein